MDKPFVVEMDEFDGEYGAISPLQGNSRFYCVAQKDSRGIATLIDYGYPELSDLYAAWPELDPYDARSVAGRDAS